MKLPILAILAALSLAASATPIADPNASLEARDVCGNGFPAYTRRIGTKCTKSDDGREYCSCNREKIVSFLFVALRILLALMRRTPAGGLQEGQVAK